MPMTFDGSVPKAITFDGQPVVKIICDGVEVWSTETAANAANIESETGGES